MLTGGSLKFNVMVYTRIAGQAFAARPRCPVAEVTVNSSAVRRLCTVHEVYR